MRETDTRSAMLLAERVRERLGRTTDSGAAQVACSSADDDLIQRIG